VIGELGVETSAPWLGLALEPDNCDLNSSSSRAQTGVQVERITELSPNFEQQCADFVGQIQRLKVQAAAAALEVRVNNSSA
jgi:hypothetical protein